MSVCSKCDHDNVAGKDFCSECGEFLGWGDDPPAPVARPAAAPAIGPTRAGATAADPAVRQAEEEAHAAEEEARLVRALAERQAAETTESAKRLATDEARRAREAAYGRAEEVVEMASRTATGSRAEVAALVAQVRREAESKAQIEVGDAELRAARKARRAREEAHARARAESAEAERKAAEAAERASALIARAPAKAAQSGQPSPNTQAATAAPPIVAARNQPTAHGAEGVAAVQPVLPGPAQWRPAPVKDAEKPPAVNPGDTVCNTCGTGNDPARRFCRKCGQSLVVVATPLRPNLSQRVRSWLRSKFGRLRRRRGEPPAETTAPGSSGPGMSLAGIARGTLAVVAVVGIFAAVGPYRKEAAADVTSLRRRVVPRPSYIEGEVAFAGSGRTVITTLTDKSLDPAPFSSGAVTATDPPDPGSPPVFSVALGKDGDLTKPVNVFKLGVIAGVLGEQPPRHPSVHHLYVVAYGKDGRQVKAKTLALRDDTSFQSFLFAANHVARVDVYVLDTYTSTSRAGPYTIDQVEFFALT